MTNTAFDRKVLLNIYVRFTSPALLNSPSRQHTSWGQYKYN